MFSKLSGLETNRLPQEEMINDSNVYTLILK